jgi:soluble lytic murein transglycosylase-like protein
MFRASLRAAMRIALVTAGLVPVFAETAAAEEVWDRRSILLSSAPDLEHDPSDLPRQSRLAAWTDIQPILYASAANYALEVGPALALLQLPAGFADPKDHAGPPAWPDILCPVLETEARTRGLPPVFFARVVWLENRFKPDALTTKRTPGTRQFMPYGAAGRGLAEPFDPVAALAASARLLHVLRDEFANLGLAAAAYHAGPWRIRDWLAGRAMLRSETEDYVLAVTGRAVAAWTEGDMILPEQTLPDTSSFQAACRLMAGAPADEETVRWPWGVQVAGSFSQDKALAAFARLRERFRAVLATQDPMVVRVTLRSRGTQPLYAVRVGADSRDVADQLCDQLRAAGGACMVVKNYSLLDQ